MKIRSLPSDFQGKRRLKAPNSPDLWTAIERFRATTDLEALDVEGILDGVRDLSPSREGKTLRLAIHSPAGAAACSLGREPEVSDEIAEARIPPMPKQ